jgi:hypothetical protein
MWKNQSNQMADWPSNISAGIQVVAPWRLARPHAGTVQSPNDEFQMPKSACNSTIQIRNSTFASPERSDYDLPRQCASTAGAANRFLIKARQGIAK